MKISGKKNHLSLLLKCLLSAAIFFSGAGQAAQYESPYKTAYRYSKTGLMLGSIQPDADGDSLNFLAQRFTYDPSRPTLVTQIESGNLVDWLDDTVAPAQWTYYSEFTIFTTRGFEYDNYGRKIKEWVKGANGDIEVLTQYTYNAKGLVRCKARRMNKAAYNSLPSDACVQSSSGNDGPDRITRYTYNDLDQVLTEERAVDTSLAQTYVTNTYNGYLVKTQTDANGNKTRLEYDDFGRLTHRYYPSKTALGVASTTDYNQYGYDLNNNFKMERKRNGSTITYTYDNNNRLTKKDLSNNTWSGDVVYDYDLRGLTLYARFGSSSGQGITNTFDGFGNLQQTTTTMGGTSRTLSYRYDNNGNRTRITHPDSVYFGYTFDNLDRVTGLTEKATALLSLDYRANGQRHTLTRGGSITTYTPDNVARLEKLTQNFAGTENDLVNSFTYIPSNQIRTFTVSNNRFRYTGEENRTGEYIVNGLNQYESIAGRALDYDANGNLTRDGSMTYTYDMENRLVKTTGGATSTFTYDPLGRLFNATVNGTTTQFLYDGDALVAEYNSSGVMTRRYVHGDQVDEPWVQYNSSSVGTGYRRYLHADHQGSIIAHSNNSGTVLNILAYDSYGIPQSTNVDRFGYTGQLSFKELGLYYYKARWYSPTLGRFLQTDPIGYQDQMNLYAYVGNDPLNMVDPTGMYGQGSGWSDEDWKKFDAAQKEVAADMSKAAGDLRNEAGGLGEGEVNGDGYSASQLTSVADSLEAGAAALNDDGSGGYLAHAGDSSDTGGMFATAGIGGKSMTVNVGDAAFQSHSNVRWMAGHESLHNAGLSDQVGPTGETAYRFGSGQQVITFKRLRKSKRPKNPDHIMSLVYP